MNAIVLRQWKDSDLEPYAAMNADPEVMRYLPARMTKDEAAKSLLDEVERDSAAMMSRIIKEKEEEAKKVCCEKIKRKKK